MTQRASPALTRTAAIRIVREHLGGRRLLYVGSRGCDASSLKDLDVPLAVVCVNAPLADPTVSELSLETETRRRVDTNRFSMETAPAPLRDLLSRGLLAFLDTPAVVVPFRPNELLTSVVHARQEVATQCAVPHMLQRAFEFKPWVDTELASLGIETLGWKYATRVQVAQHPPSDNGTPLVARFARSEGGTAVTRVLGAADWKHLDWDRGGDLVAYTPELADAVAVNVNACVFGDGQTSVHAPSLQTLGLKVATTRAFGYVGNDFGAIQALDDRVLDTIDRMVRRVGQWLTTYRYKGACGIDLLVKDGHVYFVELNPRFQGSSPLSGAIDRALDRPDMYLCHLAAWLGLNCISTTSVRELVRAQPGWSHLVCHNTLGMDAVANGSPAAAGAGADDLALRLWPERGVIVEADAILFQLISRAAPIVSAEGVLSADMHYRVRALVERFPLASSGVRPVEGEASG